MPEQNQSTPTITRPQALRRRSAASSGGSSPVTHIRLGDVDLTKISNGFRSSGLSYEEAVRSETSRKRKSSEKLDITELFMLDMMKREQREETRQQERMAERRLREEELTAQREQQRQDSRRMEILLMSLFGKKDITGPSE